MRHPLARLMLLVCLAVSLAGQSSDWHTYRNTDGNFSVLLPGEPKDSVSGDAHTIQSIVGSVGYTIVYVKLPGEQAVDEANYQLYKEGFLKELPGCDVASELPASPVLTGYIGRYYRMNCLVSNTKMTFVGNLYWGKHYGYAVFGMFGTAPSDPPGAKAFVDSFSLIDSSK